MKNENFIPSEFKYSVNKIGKGKTFIFIDNYGKKSFTDLNIISENGKECLITKQYSTDKKFDSIKTTLNDKYLETYNFMFSNKTTAAKGNILRDEVVNSDTKLGKRVSEIIYSENENIVKIETEEEYLKDTVLMWKKKKINCILIKSKSEIEFGTKKFQLLTKTINYESYSYYGNGIGILRYVSQTENEPKNISELEEIVDRK